MQLLADLSYWEIFAGSFADYFWYTWREISFQADPWYENYLMWLVALSLVVWILEIIFPWRKDQPVLRKDFWLDAFYMIFNFYIFKLIIFIAFSNITERMFSDVLGGNVARFSLVDMSQLPNWVQLIVFFVCIDFVSWATHYCLHRIKFLWRFHKVHHSVKQMGFAAHLRFHWMENVVYTPVKYIAMMLIGNFGPQQVFVVYYLAIAIGHINHANLRVDYGWLRFIFNNPKMHIWHHAKDLPESRRYGVNFGISLSCWDYIFRKNYIPEEGRDIELGFQGDERFPKRFWGQLVTGFVRKTKG